MLTVPARSRHSYRFRPQPRRVTSVDYIRPDGFAGDTRHRVLVPLSPQWKEPDGEKWSGFRTVAFFIGACVSFWCVPLSFLADERHQAPFVVLILAGAAVAFWAAGRP